MVVQNKETKQINENTKYIPIIDEPKNIEIGSFLDSKENEETSILNECKIIVKTAIITSINDWSCKLLINGKYEGKLENRDYFENILLDEGGYICGRLNRIFAVGDSIPNLECRRIKSSNVLEMYLRDKIDISKTEEYPLENIDSLEDDLILECRIREILPNCCYAKIAPKVDALCPIPENLDLDRDLEPEDLVEVRVKKSGNKVKGKILKHIEYSYFKFYEMEGETIC